MPKHEYDDDMHLLVKVCHVIKFQRLLFNSACHSGQKSDLLLLQIELLQQRKAYGDIGRPPQSD